MPYKNPVDVLVDATKFPAAIEGMLPEGAPKLSVSLAEVAGKIPTVPDLPVEIPNLPAPPELPAIATAAVTAAPSPTAVTGRLGEEILS